MRLAIVDITKKELLLRRGKERNTMELKSASYEKHEEVYDAVILEQWKACVEMANSNTEKRTNSNNIFITINAALLAVISFSLDYESIALSMVGIAVCIVWLNSIESYKKLSSVKYDIINEIELQLPLRPFTYEWERLSNENYLKLTKIEKALPILFVVLYSIAILLPILKWLPTIACNC